MRPEVNPDIVMSCTNTTFADKTFDLILFDPPHRHFSKILRKKDRNDMGRRYGSMRAAEIKVFIPKAFREFSRILKDDGLVFFKWNSCSIRHKVIMGLIHGWFPVFGQNFNKIANHDTIWLAMRKDLSGVQGVL